MTVVQKQCRIQKKTKEILDEEKEQHFEVKEGREKQSWELDIEGDALQKTGKEQEGTQRQGNKNMFNLKEKKEQDKKQEQMEELERKHEGVPAQKEDEQEEETGKCPNALWGNTTSTGWSIIL